MKSRELIGKVVRLEVTGSYLPPPVAVKRMAAKLTSALSIVAVTQLLLPIHMLRRTALSLMVVMMLVTTTPSFTTRSTGKSKRGK